MLAWFLLVQVTYCRWWTLYRQVVFCNWHTLSCVFESNQRQIEYVKLRNNGYKNDDMVDPMDISAFARHADDPLAFQVALDANDGGDEEGMLNFIKSFDAIGDVRSFLDGQLHLPPSMHDLFASLRRALGTRYKQFGDLKTFREQLSYFFDVFTELKVIPSNWVVFATSTAYLYKSTGKFAESTGNLFQSEAQLGHFCSMRAKYIIMGLKDLVQMKQMKCAEGVQQSIMLLATAVDSPVNFSSAEKGDETPLIGALSGFDGEFWLH